MAGQSLEKFDPSKLMDGVKDRIKATFVSLIPDDEWDRLVQAEIKAFFEKKTEDGWTTPKTTPFAAICISILKQDAAKRINDFLQTEEYKRSWDSYGQPVVSKAVEKVIIENSGAVLAQMIGGISSDMLQNFASQIRNRQF